MASNNTRSALPAGWSPLHLPLMAAPMFLASSLELVIACCRAGIIGAFPAFNPRTPESLAEWLTAIAAAREQALAAGGVFAPYCVNIPSSRRTDAQQRRQRLELCRQARVPLVLTNLGDPREEVIAVHEWGGLVFHDVTTLSHVERAVAAGVDGLMLVCGGAGGHAGSLNPLSFLPQVRRIFNGYLVLAGGIADGAGIAAALALGADLVAMGTRFIATRESGASEQHRQMLVSSGSEDVLYTDRISGLPASFLIPSIRAAGLDPYDLPRPIAQHQPVLPPGVRPWRDIWSGGHSTGLIDDVPTVATVVERLEQELTRAQRAPAWQARLR